MSGMFEERERAAESIFVHSEELRFLAVRRGLQSLAAWAAEGMGLDAERAKTYEGDLVGSFLSGTPQDLLVTKVQHDLEAAGKPALSTTAQIQLSRSVAEAVEALRGHKDSPQKTEDPIDTWEREHEKKSGSWAWPV